MLTMLRAMSLGSSRARPKSTSLPPCGVRKRLEGLTSRCTTPASCRAARAESRSSARSSASGAARGPRRSLAESVSPDSSSMARNGRPPSSPTSKMGHRFGWLTRAAARASLTNRRWDDSSSRLSIFSATFRRRASSSARSTRPIPPSPRSSITRYRPTRRGTCAGGARRSRPPSSQRRRFQPRGLGGVRRSSSDAWVMTGSARTPPGWLAAAQDAGVRELTVGKTLLRVKALFLSS